MNRTIAVVSRFVLESYELLALARQLKRLLFYDPETFGDGAQAFGAVGQVEYYLLHLQAALHTGRGPVHHGHGRLSSCVLRNRGTVPPLSLVHHR